MVKRKGAPGGGKQTFQTRRGRSHILYSTVQISFGGYSVNSFGLNAFRFFFNNIRHEKASTSTYVERLVLVLETYLFRTINKKRKSDTVTHTLGPLLTRFIFPRSRKLIS